MYYEYTCNIPCKIILTHWGRVTHICVNKLTIIGSDNGLSPDRCQAIIWTNAGILLIGPLGTNISEILIEILTFSFMKMRLKVSSAKRRPFCLRLNVLRRHIFFFNDLEFMHTISQLLVSNSFHINGLVQACGISSALALEIPQFSTKPLIYCTQLKQSRKQFPCSYMYTMPIHAISQEMATGHMPGTLHQTGHSMHGALRPWEHKPINNKEKQCIYDLPFCLKYCFFNSCNTTCLLQNIDWLVQERCKSHALAMEFCLSCTNPSIWPMWHASYIQISIMIVDRLIYIYILQADICNHCNDTCRSVHIWKQFKCNIMTLNSMRNLSKTLIVNVEKTLMQWILHTKGQWCGALMISILWSREICSTNTVLTSRIALMWLRAHSKLAPNQWKMSLQSNRVSHSLAGCNPRISPVTHMTWTLCVMNNSWRSTSIQIKSSDTDHNIRGKVKGQRSAV